MKNSRAQKQNASRMTLHPRSWPLIVASGTALLMGLSGCDRSRVDPAVQRQAVAPSDALDQEPISPIPRIGPIELDARKVALGQKLFHEPKLSRDNSLSCASCHPLDRGGTDHRSVPLGINGQKGEVNTPTVFNSAFNFVQFWDGRAETLEDQIDGPIQSAVEMGSTWDEVVGKLRNDSAHSAAFKEIYPDGVQPRNVKDAIAEFERSLRTPDSRFDHYLQGNAAALTTREKAGYHKFKSYGCISCHQGINIGANLYQRMGVIGDYFADRGNITKADLGRFNVTGKETDRHVFKVPSLRNVAVTAPYFHDSSAKTLEEAVSVMAKYQLGRPLPPEDLEDIVKFLFTLTGEYERKSL
jgi:cytochrome c peroxidase